jgi:hypothetical protein
MRSRRWLGAEDPPVPTIRVSPPSRLPVPARTNHSTGLLAAGEKASAPGRHWSESDSPTRAAARARSLDRPAAALRVTVQLELAVLPGLSNLKFAVTPARVNVTELLFKLQGRDLGLKFAMHTQAQPSESPTVTVGVQVTTGPGLRVRVTPAFLESSAYGSAGGAAAPALRRRYFKFKFGVAAWCQTLPVGAAPGAAARPGWRRWWLTPWCLHRTRDRTAGGSSES